MIYALFVRFWGFIYQKVCFSSAVQLTAKEGGDTLMEVLFSGIIKGGLLLLDPMTLFLIMAGTVFGIVIGALPGLTSTMGVALLVPVTFGMSPAMGLALLWAIYCSSTYAGAISAILLNIPGTPANCCTMLDGYPMTQKGESGRAIALATGSFRRGWFFKHLCSSLPGAPSCRVCP